MPRVGLIRTGGRSVGERIGQAFKGVGQAFSGVEQAILQQQEEARREEERQRRKAVTSELSDFLRSKEREKSGLAKGQTINVEGAFSPLQSMEETKESIFKEPTQSMEQIRSPLDYAVDTKQEMDRMEDEGISRKDIMDRINEVEQYADIYARHGFPEEAVKIRSSALTNLSGLLKTDIGAEVRKELDRMRLGFQREKLQVTKEEGDKNRSLRAQMAKDANALRAKIAKMTDDRVRGKGVSGKDLAATRALLSNAENNLRRLQENIFTQDDQNLISEQTALVEQYRADYMESLAAQKGREGTVPLKIEPKSEPTAPANKVQDRLKNLKF